MSRLSGTPDPSGAAQGFKPDALRLLSGIAQSSFVGQGGRTNQRFSRASKQSQHRHRTETRLFRRRSSLTFSNLRPSTVLMSVSLPSTRLSALVFAALVATGCAVAVGRTEEDASPTPVSPDADAVLIVDGIDYPFDLDTCFVGNGSFVVAGHGNQEGEDFRVLASPSEVELAFGIVDEADLVPEDSLWLSSDEAVSWSAEEARVIAQVELAERLGDDAARHDAELRVDCGVTS